MAQKRNEKLNQQLKNVTDRVKDGITPDWIDILRNILGRWETWVAVAATGGTVTYFVAGGSPPSINIPDINIGNQINNEISIPDDPIDLFNFSNDTDQINQTVDLILIDLFDDAELFQNIGFEDTRELDISTSAERDIQGLIEIYNESKL